MTDRLGTVRNGTMYSYFPWAEPRTSKRARVFTYTPDASGQDYADQRYYNSTIGRFWSGTCSLAAGDDENGDGTPDYCQGNGIK